MLKAAVIILIVMLAYAGVFSLMNIIAPTLVAKGVLATAGKTLDNARGDGYLKVLVADQIKTGVFGLATVAAGFFVLFAAFRKAQRWAWYGFLVVGGISWLNGLIIAIAIADTMNIFLNIIGMVIFLVGLLLPIKAFFKKAA